MNFISNTLTVSAIATVFVASVAFAQTTSQSGSVKGEIKQQDRTTGAGDKQGVAAELKADRSTGSMNSTERPPKREVKQQDRTTGVSDKQGVAVELKATQNQNSGSLNVNERTGKPTAKQQDRTTGPGDRAVTPPGGSIQNQ